eukprot:scaffold46183_cov17-Tisochrysis_lutea.AAC.3
MGKPAHGRGACFASAFSAIPCHAALEYFLMLCLCKEREPASSRLDLPGRRKKTEPEATVRGYRNAEM